MNFISIIFSMKSIAPSRYTEELLLLKNQSETIVFIVRIHCVGKTKFSLLHQKVTHRHQTLYSCYRAS